MKIVCTLLIFLISLHCIGQLNPNLEKQKIAISKLSTLVGEWEGIAETQQGPNNTITLTQHEKVEMKLDSTILLIEGTGLDESGQLAFNAIAVISFNGVENRYEMKSFTNMGLETEADFELTEKGFKWGFKTPQGGQVRYEATLTDNTWIEQGAYSQDGAQWFDFVTLNLTKKK